MAFITPHELLDIGVMTLILGFLFKDTFRPTPTYSDDPLKAFKKPRTKWKDFLFATAIIAPSIIIHELAHKFTAMGYGLDATFHAFYANPTTLVIGAIAIAARLLGSGLVLLIPGYVHVLGEATAGQHALIAFAGPAVHLLFWIGGKAYLHFKKKLTERQRQFATLTANVNGLLLILNMLPIPGVDGHAVYTNLIQALA
ncbi:M50 family metallopeptidase [Candidatus Woesearchaeota archaeon]|nr:M50 family metallopeptidase [Candidatus Woesearchaeota archaeon]